MTGDRGGSEDEGELGTSSVKGGTVLMVEVSLGSVVSDVCLEVSSKGLFISPLAPSLSLRKAFGSVSIPTSFASFASTTCPFVFECSLA